MKTLKNKLKIFFYGFHYGVINYSNTKEDPFVNWGLKQKDNTLYRRAVLTGKIYSIYKTEIYSSILIFIAAIILFTI